MAFKWGIKISLRHVRNPHIKKRVVTIAMAGLSVEVGKVVAAGAAFELAMDIASELSRYSVWTGDAGCSAFYNSLLHDADCKDAFPVDLRTTNSGSINISATYSSLFLI